MAALEASRRANTVTVSPVVRPRARTTGAEVAEPGFPARLARMRAGSTNAASDTSPPSRSSGAAISARARRFSPVGAEARGADGGERGADERVARGGLLGEGAEVLARGGREERAQDVA